MRFRLVVGAILSALVFCVLPACSKHRQEPTHGATSEAEPLELTVVGSAELESPLRAALSKYRQPAKLLTATPADMARRVGGKPVPDLVVLPEGDALSTLESSGKLVKGSVRPLVQDHLVIIGFPKCPIPLKEPTDLSRLGAENPPWRGRLMVLDPATPVGALTRTYLQSLHAEGGSVWDVIDKRRSVAPDVLSIERRLQVVQRMLGIVATHDAAKMGEKVKIVLPLTEKDAPRLRYDVGVVQTGHTKEARQLADFLAAPPQIAVFTKQGFQRAEKAK
jgi:ABC-type molybdate transport system substrate-binding protein